MMKSSASPGFASRSHRSRAEAGFSVVEGLVAALILLIVVLGVLPLVSQSLRNNVQGNDATNQSNAAIDELDLLLGLPFNSQLSEIVAGTTTTTASEIFLSQSLKWVDATGFAHTGNDLAKYQRTYTVDQYQSTDLESDDTLDTPLDGSTPPGQVSFKRIRLDVYNRRGLDTLFTDTPAFEIISVQAF